MSVDFPTCMLQLEVIRVKRIVFKVYLAMT